MLKFLNRFVEDKAGATAIEYALIATFIGVALITVMSSLGTSLSTTFSTSGGHLGATPK